jgi:hypothetical protein
MLAKFGTLSKEQHWQLSLYLPWLLGHPDTSYCISCLVNVVFTENSAIRQVELAIISKIDAHLCWQSIQHYHQPKQQH